MKKKEPEWDGSPFLIGEYQLGYRMVDVICYPDNKGGKCQLCDGSNNRKASIEVGFGWGYADEAYAVLMHEAQELCLNELMCAFKPLAFVEDASDIREFHYSHSKHTELCARVSFFLYRIHKDFFNAWEKCQKLKRNKKTK